MGNVKVKIDLLILRENLSAADQRPVSDEAVRQFLIDSGFIPEGDYWIVEEKDLGQLDPSEVLSAEPLNPS